MKYDAQIGELQNRLSQSTSCLVSLPAQPSVDKLAAALALYLSLKQSGKTVAIASEADLRVAQANLFGIGDIRQTLPESTSGNFIMRFTGVVENGKVSALESLDWYPDGNDLNLVFHVAPGKKFEPINITHSYETAAFQTVFFVGAANLSEFGNLYSQNIGKLGDSFKVNIDNGQSNNLFGNVNIVDPGTASVSEVVCQVMQGLGLPQDADIASNIIAGIYDVTAGLSQNVSGDTFIVVGQCMQMGGKVPNIVSQINASGFDIRPFAQPAGQGVPAQNQAVSQALSQPDEEPEKESQQPPEQAKSQQEVPTGEFASSPSPESASPAPDWLTPKIFKGGSLG